jgi:hypothetical protein
MGGNGDCLEAASIKEGIAVRDSKNLNGPILRYSHDAWRSFVRQAKRGNFDSFATASHLRAVEIQE